MPFIYLSLAAPIVNLSSKNKSSSSGQPIRPHLFCVVKYQPTMLVNLLLSFCFHLVIVNATLHSAPSAKRWVYLKGVNPSDIVTHPSSNSVPQDQLTHDSSRSNQPASGVNSTTRTNNEASTNDIDKDSDSLGSPEPKPEVTSICTGSSGKAVTFIDRECWHAAKAMSSNRNATSQCGNCVLGLFDADKKEPFQPTGPLNATFIEQQAMNLLEGCKSNSTHKVTKRDSSPSNSSSQGVNLQLLVGYRAEANPCPGL